MEVEVKRDNDFYLGWPLQKEHRWFAKQHLWFQLLSNVHIKGHVGKRVIGVGGDNGARSKGGHGRRGPGIGHEGGVTSASTPNGDIVDADECASLGILLDKSFVKELDDLDDVRGNFDCGGEADGFGVDGTERAHNLLSVSHC